MEYETFSLKEEVFVGDQLMFGNFYAGAVHGTKVQAQSGLPAPNITLNLVDMQGVIQYTAVTDAEGKYWFTDVRPGMYSLEEAPADSVITPINATADPGQLRHGSRV